MLYNLFSPLIKVYKELYVFAYGITGDYGFSLIVLSLFTFIVLYPFNKKAQEIQNKEHKIQSVLSPQIDEIKKQYSGREQYEQLQWLYQRYGYHPLYAIRSAVGFVLQIPFLTAAYYMLSGLSEIRGVSWGFIPDLGSPDYLLGGINLLPFIMTLVTVVYAFVMPGIHKKEQLQTVLIGFFFLILLYSAPSALLIFWTCNLLWSLLDSVLGKKLEWLGEYISENELAFHIIFALSLTIGLLVPSDIYVKNASQLWFSFADILKYFLADTAKYYTVFLLIYVLCWRKITRVAYLSILLGLLFGVFLQSYIIGLDYGTFDGHEIEWGKYTRLGIANTVIWLACIGETFIRFYRQQFDSNTIKRFVKPIVFGIIVVQCVVLTFALKNSSFEKDIRVIQGKVGVLTTKNMYTLSSHDNIIVFLLDMFDASVFEDIQKMKPEAAKIFKDFTYYPDTTSSFGFTHFSLPEILTGKLYDPRERYPEYLNRAWKNNINYRELTNNNYEIDLYTSGNYVDKDAVVDNLVVGKVSMDKTTADSFGNLVKFRVAPHYLKYIFHQYRSYLQIPIFAISSFSPYEENDLRFYVDLQRGLKLANNSNAFRFYHLKGLHPPYTLDENMRKVPDEKKGTLFGQSLGCLKIVSEYLLQLKRLGVYENTTFVVMADHGYHNTIGGRPLLLVKQPHYNNQKLIVDNTPQTVSNIMALILQRFQKEKSVQSSLVKNTNRFFYYENEKKGMQFVRYLVKSPASNKSSWIVLGPVEKNLVKDKQYKIGETIDFTCFGNSYKYKGSGWGDREETFGSLIAKREANIDMVINEKVTYQKDYIVEIVCNPLLHFFPADRESSYRDMELYANENLIGKWRFSKAKTDKVSCKLPLNVIKQSRLNLRFVIINPADLNLSEIFQVNEIKIKEE